MRSPATSTTGSRCSIEHTTSTRTREQDAIEFVWTPLRVEAELIAGDTAGASARAASNVEELMRIGERAFASTRALHLAGARLLLDDEPGADRWTSFAEENALASDVLPQFLRRSLRARLLARAAPSRTRKGWRGTL